MKKVLVRSYYGDVFVECARNKSRKDIVQATKDYWGKETDPCITDLPNLEYYTEAKQRQLCNLMDGIEYTADTIRI